MGYSRSLLDWIRFRCGDSLIQNSYYLMAGAVISMVTSTLFWVFAARFCDASVLGYASVLISSMGLLSIIANLGFGLGLIHYLPHSGVDKTATINTSLTVVVCASVSLSIVFVGVSSILAPDLGAILWQPLFSLSFIIFALVWTLIYISSCIFLAGCASRLSFQQSLMTGMLKLALLGVTLVFFCDTYGLLASFGLSMLFVLLYTFRVLIPRIHPDYVFRLTIERKIIKLIAGYSLGNYLSRTLLEVSPLILPLVVLRYVGPDDSAYFYISWSIAYALAIIPTSISNSLFAIGSNSQVDFKKNCIRSIKYIVTLTSLAAVIVILLAEYILSVFGGEYSQKGDYALRLLALSVIPYGVNYYFISVARARRRVKYLIGVSVLLTGLALGGSIAMVSSHGLNGISEGWLAGQAVVALSLALHWLIRGSAFLEPQSNL